MSAGIFRICYPIKAFYKLEWDGNNTIHFSKKSLNAQIRDYCDRYNLKRKQFHEVPVSYNLTREESRDLRERILDELLEKYPNLEFDLKEISERVVNSSEGEVEEGSSDEDEETSSQVLSDTSSPHP